MNDTEILLPVATHYWTDESVSHYCVGDLVVILAAAPTVCTVAGVEPDGLVRVMRPDWPNGHVRVARAELQHFASWVLADNDHCSRTGDEVASAQKSGAGAERPGDTFDGRYQ